MKYFLGGVVFTLVAVGLMAATTNRLNFLTQVLSPGTSTSGKVLGILANGSNAFIGVGTGLSIDASGNLNATAAPTINFANAVNVPGTPNGTTTAFTLAQTPKSSVAISINGLGLDPSQFTVSGTTVTFVVAPSVGDNLQATYLF